FPAWTRTERRINVGLDAALGRGSDLKTWFTELRSGDALISTGTTLLIRYGEVSATAAPKFVDAYFGHGVYTSKGARLFTAKLVADHFYPPSLAILTDPAQPMAIQVVREESIPVRSDHVRARALAQRVRTRIWSLARMVLATCILVFAILRQRFAMLL